MAAQGEAHQLLNAAAAGTVFSQIPQAPPIVVFALTQAYNADAHPNKVNLGVGAYRTDDGKPWVLPVVKTVEKQMANDPAQIHEYLPVQGIKDLTQASCRLLLGEDSLALAENRAFGIAGLGGTGCLRLAAEFLHRFLGSNIVYITKPTWGNHKTIFKYAMFEEIREYRYWNTETRALDFDGLTEDLRAAPEGAVVVLHAVAHNPTGMDPTEEQWKAICNIVKERRLFPLFDVAYQGFASGDLDKDAFAVRYFASQKMEFFAAQSYSKNFGLYNERVGNLCVMVNDQSVVSAMKSQFELIVRTTWSNPPAQGGRIVSSVLNNPALYAEWKENVRTMAERIASMRQLLFQKLKALGTPGTWTHIVEQIGMFSFLGISPKQVDYIKEKFHIYMMNSSRISMAGVTTKNVDYIAQAIHDAVTSVPEDPKL